jgi:hypothetical protein
MFVARKKSQGATAIKATDLMIVSKAVHTDSQLSPDQSGKAAHTGRIPFFSRLEGKGKANRGVRTNSLRSLN